MGHLHNSTHADGGGDDPWLFPPHHGGGFGGTEVPRENLVGFVDGDGGLPHVCRSLVGTLSVFKYLEGVFSGVVAVGFTLYAFTFNGLVYAVLTNAKDLSKLQRAVVGNQILRFLLSP